MHCNFCQKDSGDVSMPQQFVLLPTFLIVELSSNCIDQLFFPLTMDMLGQRYVLKGVVRCSSHNFTVAVKDDTRWVYIDDMCVLVMSYTTFQDLLHNHPNNWFFAIFEHCSLGSYNNMQTIAETSETVCHDSNLLVDSSLVDLPYPIFDRSTSAVSVTKSCTCYIFYAICFSILNSSVLK